MARLSPRMDNRIKLATGECERCDGALVLFNGSTVGPCPHCHILYGLATNIRPAGELEMNQFERLNWYKEPQDTRPKIKEARFFGFDDIPEIGKAS